MKAVVDDLGLSRYAVLRLIELGFVSPEKTEQKAGSFTFQDMVVLRSAQKLRAARIPTRQILRALSQLRTTLPDKMPALGLRITAEGDQVTVRSADVRWEPESGQLVLDLQVAAGRGSISHLPRRQASAVGAPDLDELFARAEALEEAMPREAEDLYRYILVEDPGHAHAYLNLGFMLCEAGRCNEASALYEDGLRFCPDDPLMHFNRAVALEGIGDVAGALASYEEALRLQPALLDGHRNAALLYAHEGDKQMAIRHFSAYRRLTREDPARH